MKNKELLLEEMDQSLTSKGLEVESPSHILGRSGVTHSFDMKIMKDSAKQLLMDVEASEHDVDEISIMKHFVKNYDVGAKHLLITYDGIAPHARKLSKLYHMDVFETGRSDDMNGLTSVILERL